MVQSYLSDSRIIKMDKKVCRVCPYTDQANLISPCHCKGGEKYVHIECIKSTSCADCKFTYITDRKSYNYYLATNISFCLMTYALMCVVAFLPNYSIAYLFGVPTLVTLYGPILGINTNLIILLGVSRLSKYAIPILFARIPILKVYIFGFITMIIFDIMISKYSKVFSPEMVMSVLSILVIIAGLAYLNIELVTILQESRYVYNFASRNAKVLDISKMTPQEIEVMSAAAKSFVPPEPDGPAGSILNEERPEATHTKSE